MTPPRLRLSQPITLALCVGALILAGIVFDAPASSGDAEPAYNGTGGAVVMKYGFGDERCTAPAGPAGIRFVECPDHLK